MKTESSLIGGAVNAEKRRIAPTLMPEADFDHPIMEDEIFGPLLPIIAVKDMQNAVAHIKTLPNPLACYVFTENKAVAEAVIANLSFGGGCINDTLLHVTNPNLPLAGWEIAAWEVIMERQALMLFPIKKASSRTRHALTFPCAMPRLRKEK